MRAKNRATMSVLGYFWSVFDLIFGANFVGEVGRCQFSRLLRLYCGEGPCSVMAWIMIWSSHEMLLINPPQKCRYNFAI